MLQNMEVSNVEGKVHKNNDQNLLSKIEADVDRV